MLKFYKPAFLFSSILLSNLLWSCNSGTSSSNDIETTHFNITITPDLSNRLNNDLYPKPITDQVIVQSVIDNFYPNFVTYSLSYHTDNSRKSDQLDRLQVGPINQKLISQYGVDFQKMKIDLSSFSNQTERIKYLTNQSSNNLGADKEYFINSYNELYKKALSSPARADVWTYFNDGIKQNVVDTTVRKTELRNNGIKRDIKCNVLLLLTDGYIEAGLQGKDHCEGNKCYFFSSKTIEGFRKAFKESGATDMQKFFIDNGYGIIPVNNPFLKDLNVLVMEIYDRSKDFKGGATIHPSDLDIIKLFWTDWMKKSGVKSFELFPLANAKDEAYSNVKNFLQSR